MRRIIRLRILVGVFLGLISLYALAGFLLLPYLIKAYGIPAAADHLNHPIVVREVALNPFTLSLRLNGLEVQETDQTPILGFEEFFVNLRATTLFFQTLGFDEIRLVTPFMAAKVNREGKLNLLALVPPSDDAAAAPPAQTTTSEPKKMMPVEIGLLEINQGILEYRDQSKPKPLSIDIVPIQILLRNFSTIQGSENAYAFTAEIGKGEALAWEGTISLEPVESDGRVSLSGVKIRTLYQAVQDQFQFDVQQGELGLSALYHFDLRGQVPHATVKNGKISVRNLAIGERGGTEPVVGIPVFDIEAIQLDLEKQTIDIAKIHSENARFEAWIDPDGVLNYQSLFAPVGGSAAAPEKPPSPNPKQEKAPKPWSITIGEIGLRNYRTMFEDRTLTRPSHVDVDAMNFTVKDVQIPFKKPLPIDLSMKLNETGSVGVKGKVAVEPLKADADLTLEHIDIRPFQPYLDRFLDVDVRDGAINLKGAAHYAKEHPKGPMLQFQGNLSVDQLAIADRTEFDDVVTWKSLAVNRLSLDVEPTAVKIAEVLWQEPSVQVAVESDGRLNLSRFLVPPPSGGQVAGKKETEGEKQTTKPAEPVPVTVDQVKLVKMAATFQDLSIEPKVKTSLTEFGGTIKGLSSKQLKRADVNLAGKVGRAAPLKIAGKINPLSEDAFTDLAITLGGMDLTPAGPYSGKYAGYGLSKGKLSLDLKYKVSQKLLEAENLVQVDQLTFGEKTNSPDATSLPVPLVVALLKDRKGLIEIDMPIRGDLNDPDFKYGKVVISTLLNLLGKIVASPFSLMGKLIPGGGSEEDLQFIEFQPGSASLIDDEIKKLDALQQALDERAGLRLDIKGTADSTLDRAALRLRKLRDQLLAMRQEESGKAKAEEAELSAEDEQRLVEKLFAKLPVPSPEPAAKTPETAEAKPPTLEEMKQRLASAIPVTEAELEALARQRGEVVRNHLLENGKLTEERVLLLDVNAAESGHDKVRTQLALAAAS